MTWSALQQFIGSRRSTDSDLGGGYSKASLQKPTPAWNANGHRRPLQSYAVPVLASRFIYSTNATFNKRVNVGQ